MPKSIPYWAVAGLVLIVACSKSSDTTPPTVVAIAQASADLQVGQSTTFTANVTNNSNTAVTWNVIEADGGTISTAGVYTAPFKSGTFHVQAVSAADTTKKAQASVVVSSSIMTTITDGTVGLGTGKTYQFKASVQNDTWNQGVTWSVKEANGGSVNASGTYTAPATAGTYHVVATANSDLAKTASATVNVMNTPAGGVTVSISPKAAVFYLDHSVNTLKVMGNGKVDRTVSKPRAILPGALPPNESVQFNATVNGAADTSVIFEVVEAGGGTIDARGNYLVPGAAGLYHVRAYASADRSVYDEAMVWVNATQVAADGFVYIDPTGTGWKLVQKADISSPTVLRLDLSVPAAASVTARGFTFNLESQAIALPGTVTNYVVPVSFGRAYDNTPFVGWYPWFQVAMLSDRLVGQYGAFEYGESTSYTFDQVYNPSANYFYMVQIAFDPTAGVPAGTVIPLAVAKPGILNGTTGPMTAITNGIQVGTLIAVKNYH